MLVFCLCLKCWRVSCTSLVLCSYNMGPEGAWISCAQYSILRCKYWWSIEVDECLCLPGVIPNGILKYLHMHTFDTLFTMQVLIVKWVACQFEVVTPSHALAKSLRRHSHHQLKHHFHHYLRVKSKQGYLHSVFAMFIHTYSCWFIYNADFDCQLGVVTPDHALANPLRHCAHHSHWARLRKVKKKG